jgi:hypothetical protein
MVAYSGATTVGANGISPRFGVACDSKLTAVILAPHIATTAAGSQPLLYVRSGTTTSTSTLTVLTSGSQAKVRNVLATTISLLEGDSFYVTHGTDATAVCGVAIQTFPNGGATLAFP